MHCCFGRMWLCQPVAIRGQLPLDSRHDRFHGAGTVRRRLYGCQFCALDGIGRRFAVASAVRLLERLAVRHDVHGVRRRIDQTLDVVPHQFGRFGILFRFGFLFVCARKSAVVDDKREILWYVVKAEIVIGQ